MRVVRSWRTSIGLAGAVVAAFIAADGGRVRAQEPTLPPSFLDCGPLWLTGSTAPVAVNVGNSHRYMAAAAEILIRLVDSEGDTLASRTVALGAGRSRSLHLRLPARTDGAARLVRAEIVHLSGGPSDLRLFGTVQAGGVDSFTTPLACVPNTLPRNPD